MGEVYKGRDTRLDRSIAIKILPLHLSSNPELRLRFEQEAKSISGLQHPNICVLHDIGSQDGVDFMVMEFVPGRTLDKLIPAGGLPPEIALKYAVQVAEGLACAHASGVVHRDLKPTNIMVDEQGRCKVLDFGLAKLIAPLSAPASNDTATMTTSPGMIMGTVAYMSPEQAEGKTIGPASDIFSFGSVLYEMLSGKRAFEGNSTAALISALLRDAPKPLSDIRHDVPAEIRRILGRCLKKLPDARYADATELAKDLKNCRELLFPESGAVLTPERIVREVRRPRVLVPLALALIALMAGAIWLGGRYREARWARQVALPEIARLGDEGKFGEAFALASRADKSIADDPAMAKTWTAIAYTVSIETTPAGARVFRREYSDSKAPWEFVGLTPLRDVRAPRGNFIWKLEKEGYGTVLRTTTALYGGFSPVPGTSRAAQLTLDELEKIPAGMVHVTPPRNYPQTLFIPGYDGMPQLDLKDYWIDQYEVTNRQFKAFVDHGGYQKREFWKFDFVKNDHKLSWEEAMGLFRDSAGRSGPKDWSLGDFPKGQDDFPVTGVSWYEAAAYAEFAGKSLPTIYHWNRAAGPSAASFIVPLSNFGGAGVLPVGSKPGMSLWGNFDMAGNVKEWTWTEAEAGRRYVLGGAWDDPSYMFIDPDAQSPFLRTAKIGFRCVKYPSPDSIPKLALAAMPSPRRDLSKEKPVSDDVFRAYTGLYSYDKTPLNASVEHLTNPDEEWTTEKVTYAAPYGNERAILYLMIPKKGNPPFQTVLFFPGSNALTSRTYSLYSTAALDALLKSGRAVIYPIYKSTYERGDGLESDVANMSSSYRDHVIMWAKDASRALDYAESRRELDHQKIAYYGYSWGAVMGAIIPAVDPRIKTCLIVLGGLDFARSLPEVDIINFVSRVKQPTLMLNGRYDFFFPIESTQEPFFQWLGSKKGEKKHLVFETGHNVQRSDLIRESLNWLDQYLGPVN
jgi:eukaryotic-like serine/threonine-protein kinase